MIKELVSICIAVRVSREQMFASQCGTTSLQRAGVVAICESLAFSQLVLDLELPGLSMSCLMVLVAQFPSR